MIVSAALLCLSLNLYHEARGESIMGQYAVAMVTLNRAKQDKRQVCEVVFKAKQFSWANKGVTKTAYGWKLDARHDPKDVYAWWLAKRIAKQSLTGRVIDFTRGSMFYHTTKVRPVWRHALVPTRKIGNHQFYSLPA